MQREYKNLIFTEHAMQRMRRRRISQDAVVQVVRKPQVTESEDNGNKRFVRVVKDRNYHVIAKYLTDEKRWLIVSAWVRGEDDPEPLWRRVLLLPFRVLRRLLR